MVLADCPAMNTRSRKKAESVADWPSIKDEPHYDDSEQPGRSRSRALKETQGTGRPKSNSRARAKSKSQTRAKSKSPHPSKRVTFEPEEEEPGATSHGVKAAEGAGKQRTKNQGRRIV